MALKENGARCRESVFSLSRAFAPRNFPLARISNIFSTSILLLVRLIFSSGSCAGANTNSMSTLPRLHLFQFKLALLLCPLLVAGQIRSAVAQPTQAPELFRFHRDDSAPGGLTNIRFNAARMAKAPIQPMVFSNFLEHLGGVLYEGVWANALQNPNLERIETTDTMPPWWDDAGTVSWAPGGYLSPLSVRLNDDKGTLSQRVFLPVHRVRTYTLTLWARAATGAGDLNISLRSTNDVNGPIALSDTLQVRDANWRRYRLRLTAPDSIQKGQVSRLVFSLGGGKPVDVDQIEMFPTDAVDGKFDPDVVRAARAWHIPLLRYAGNFSSGYHFRDGIGPREERPTLRNPAWGGVESNHFGTDEFLRFCELIGATPQIAVNAGNGAPEEAADWVRYVNGKKKRVALWEIGNELYGDWQIGHTDAPGNANRFVRFRDAMLHIDPRIQIIATGKGDELSPDGLERNHVWNQSVLRAALENGGRSPDYLSIHPLVGLPGDIGNLPYAEQFESAMADPTFVDRTLLPSIIGVIKEVQGPNAKTRIAPNEWGIIIVGNDGDNWTKGPNHDVLAGAIFNALTLNTFLRHSDWVTLANMTALMHGGGIKKPNGVVIVDPQYYTEQLYATAAPTWMVETDWTGPGHDVPARGSMPAVRDTPDVDVTGALSADRTRLMAFVVNRSLDQTRRIKLGIEGFKSRAVSATILTATDPQARNTWEKPDSVAPRPFLLTGAGTDSVLEVPPHSLVVFTFRSRS